MEERGARTMRLRAAPVGTARLAADIVQSGQEFSEALTQAVQRGDAAEDRSQGHALAHDPATRAIQERFVVYATRDLTQVRLVLRSSSDIAQRALAAQVLGYARDKQAVVEDLVRAMSDPSEEVRNNAMRALLVFRRPPTGRERLDHEHTARTVHRVLELANVVRPKQGVWSAVGALSESGAGASHEASEGRAHTAC
jgi:HEAT repeats